MKILVVDTDPNMLQLLERELTAEGHEVSTCQAGSEALTASIMREFDLLITELTIPDLPGTEIVSAIKSSVPHLPVIVITSLNPEEWAQPSQDAGATGFLQKPFKIEALREEVGFVQMGRAEAMSVAIIDPDYIHRVHLTKAFKHLGCQVNAWGDVKTAVQHFESHAPPSLLLLDSSLRDVWRGLVWATKQHILAFVYADEVNDEIQDTLMRAGAALILSKPIQCEALITQARFLVSSF